MTHLSQATCARIAELMPDLFLPTEFFDKEGRIGLDAVLSREFLIAAFGEGKMVCSCGDGFEADDLNWEPCINCHKMYLWERHGHKLLEAYWTSGVEGVEELLLGLLTDSSPIKPAPK